MESAALPFSQNVMYPSLPSAVMGGLSSPVTGSEKIGEEAKIGREIRSSKSKTSEKPNLPSSTTGRNGTLNPSST